MTLYYLIHLLYGIVAFFVFKAFRVYYIGSSGSSIRQILNGVIERLFLQISLFFGFHHSLTLFGALKVGTRIKSEENKVSNDYFSIGNLISAGLAILAIGIWNYLK